MQGRFGLNYAWLRLEMGRDALHWGPGFYNNLTLNRQAVPYGYFSVDLVFGPLRVISFYSKLEIDSVGTKIHSDGRRHLYGHRYELALGNATFGMSEIQVIYNNNNPWLLVPIFPQFMEKGNYTERSNNGALAFDANYRLFRFARVYGEFYLEDLDSPMAVIENEYLNSQWALMLGTQGNGTAVGVFYRVREQVRDDLLQTDLIAVQAVRYGGIHLDHKIEPFFCRTRSYHIGKVAEHGRKLVINGDKVGLARFDLREIKYVVYKTEQRVTRFPYILGIFKSLFLAALTEYHLVHSENSVYRRSYLMGHVGKEIAFCLRHIFRKPPVLLQQFYISALVGVVVQTYLIAPDLSADEHIIHFHAV